VYADEKFDRVVAGRCIRVVSMQPRYPAPLRFVVRLVSPDPFSMIGGRAIADLSSPLDEASVQILDAIAAKPRQLDEIAVLIDRDPQRVSQCLMQLQLSGFVRHGPDGYIRLL
jgi:predicted Rossmann fold nucleotide-binding protein DprA/Smf involved in DNA uptake